MVSTHEFERRTEQMKGDIIGAYEDIHEIKETVGRIEVRVRDVDEKAGLMERHLVHQAENVRSLEKQMVDVRKTLGAHGDRLDVQSTHLERHGELLERHGELLEQHGRRLEVMDGRLDAMDGKLDTIIRVVGGGPAEES